MFQEGVCSIIIFAKFIIVMHRGAECTVARGTTFATATQKNYGSSVWNLYHDTVPMPRIFLVAFYVFVKLVCPLYCRLLKNEFNIEGHTASNDSISVTEELQNICKEVVLAHSR